jgi:hypothetical protein
MPVKLSSKPIGRCLGVSEDDWHYIYDDYIDYGPNLPPHYADPDRLPDRLPDRYERKSGRRSERGRRDESDDVDSPQGLVSAKTVFGIIVFTALATAVLNPHALIYTLPLATLLATMLALAKRGRRRREPRRLKACSDT